MFNRCKSWSRRAGSAISALRIRDFKRWHPVVRVEALHALVLQLTERVTALEVAAQSRQTGTSEPEPVADVQVVLEADVEVLPAATSDAELTMAKDGLALQYAIAGANANSKLVLTAVKQNGLALQLLRRSSRATRK